MSIEKRLTGEADFQNKREEITGEARDAFDFFSGKATDLFYEILKKHAKGKILVAGCATGTVTPLAKMGYHTTGIDISPVAIEKLNKAIVREGLSEIASAFVGNAEDVDFEDESFDVVCCSGALHHLDIQRALKSWARVLKPEGKIIFVEPQHYNPFAAVYRVLTPSQHSKDEHPLRPSDIKYIKKRFDIENYQAVNFLTPISLLFAWSIRLKSIKLSFAKTLSDIDQFFFDTFPFTQYLAWSVICCIKKK